jgi:methylase of polypeptide subunit release factors
MDARHSALVSLGRALRDQRYQFVTVTPATHKRVLDHPRPATLQSIFGWNLPFDEAALPRRLFDLLNEADALERDRGRYRSTVRFATLSGLLFAHSGFPTTAQDAVFFGPDTYRFARLLRASLPDMPAKMPPRVVDIGSGSGAGGIYAARLLENRADVVLADINPQALAFSAVNAAINEVPSVRTVSSDVLAGIDGEIDVVIANPPYLLDADRRLYRHGGGALGIALSLQILEQSLDRLVPGGRLILYTGTPVIGGIDAFFESAEPLLKLHAGQFRYEEIDPDVFGEELAIPAYAQTDRIAVVGLIADKRKTQ